MCEGKNYVGERPNTIKLAAWVLIILGTYETALLVWAVMSNRSFSGGAFLYIIAGIFLFKKNKTDYRFVLILFTAIFALLLAGIAILGLTSLQIATATDIPLSWSGTSFEAIAIATYIVAVPILVALLHHPNTREALSLKTFQGTIYTLYMSRVRFVSVIGVSIAFAILLGGPHLLHNPYKVVVSKIAESKLVANNVGKIERLDLVSTGENNWYVVSYWKVFGTKTEEKYKTVLGPDSMFTVERYSEERDCTSNKALNNDAVHTRTTCKL